MNPIQQLVNKAQRFRQESKLQDALACYRDAFDLLVKEAHEHARGIEGSVIDNGATRTVNPKLFSEVKKYLTQDQAAATISNNMGTISALLGDADTARKMSNEQLTSPPMRWNTTILKSDLKICHNTIPGHHQDPHVY